MGFLGGGGGFGMGGGGGAGGGAGGFGGAQGPGNFINGNTPMSTGRLNFPGMGGNMGLDMHRIPIIGNMFQNPYDMFKQQQMQNAAGAYSMYRPEAAQGFANAANAQSQNLQPMNNALAAMYGSDATQGYASSNPFGKSAFDRGSSAAVDPRSPERPNPSTGSSGTTSATGTNPYYQPSGSGQSGATGSNPYFPSAGDRSRFPGNPRR